MVICSRIIKLTRLYCMNGGHHLQILPDGTVGGKRDENDIHSKTRNSRIFQYFFHLRTQNPLCSIVTDPCYFLEKMVNHYNTYKAQKYQERSCYVGLKKNGKPKLDSRTPIGQKAIFFLPR
ncbi:putative fibroblast growth factor 1 [Salmo salar]|uniref:Fibroblast growth factor 1 n=1 Tax=Salmo salar TaxID=8030 RepID=A0ABM3FCB9_SALSA|nr:putative fibroblast growth factor 1 [Salmo salar]